MAHRPLTRSSVKPRLLFQEEIKKRQKALHPHDTDEEAVTDIEIKPAPKSPRKSRKIEESNEIATPQQVTPPATVRTTRRKLFSLVSNAISVDKATEISFNSWTRVKSAARESSSSSRERRKRSGEPLEGNSEKRSKTEPSSSMALD